MKRDEFWVKFGDLSTDDYILVSNFLAYLNKAVDKKLETTRDSSEKRIERANHELRDFRRLASIQDKDQLAKMFKKNFRNKINHAKIREIKEDIHFLVEWVVDESSDEETSESESNSNNNTNTGITSDDLNAAIDKFRGDVEGIVSKALKEHDIAHPEHDHTDITKQMQEDLRAQGKALKQQIEAITTSDPETIRQVEELKGQLSQLDGRIGKIQRLLNERSAPIAPEPTAPGVQPSPQSGPSLEENTALEELLKQLSEQAKNRDESFVENINQIYDRFLDQMSQVLEASKDLPDGMQDILTRLSEVIEALVQDKGRGEKQPEKPPQPDEALQKIVDDRFNNLETSLHNRLEDIDTGLRYVMDKYVELDELPAKVRAEVMSDLIDELNAVRDEVAKGIKKEDVEKAHEHLKKSFTQRIGKVRAQMERLTKAQESFGGKFEAMEGDLHVLRDQIDTFAKHLSQEYHDNEVVNRVVGMLQNESLLLSQLISEEAKNKQTIKNILKHLPGIPNELREEQKLQLKEFRESLSIIVQILHKVDTKRHKVVRQHPEMYADYLVNSEGEVVEAHTRIGVAHEQLVHIQKSFGPALPAGEDVGQLTAGSQQGLRGDFKKLKGDYADIKKKFPLGANRFRSRKAKYEDAAKFYERLWKFTNDNSNMLVQAGFENTHHAVESFMKLYNTLVERGFDSEMPTEDMIEELKHNLHSYRSQINRYGEELDNFFETLDKIINGHSAIEVHT